MTEYRTLTTGSQYCCCSFQRYSGLTDTL